MQQQQRQNQQRNLGVGSQNGEAHSSMPVGTKLQGHVETVKDKFGFIRYGNYHFRLPRVQEPHLGTCLLLPAMKAHRWLPVLICAVES